MQLRAALGGAALAAIVAVAACADTPTDPMTQPEFDLSALFGRASGAQPGEPTQAEYEFWDDNGNGLVCVKTVPEGKGKDPARTILKDDKDGTCPGGFEVTEVGGGLPACEPNVFYPDTESCACEGDAWSPPLPPGYLCGSA